jgi:hypothetical protein
MIVAKARPCPEGKLEGVLSEWQSAVVRGSVLTAA